MICILHGYLLEGSGSNLWTRAVVRAMCRAGHDVHLVCQEPHPEDYDFIAAAHLYEPDGTVTTSLERETPFAGRCIMHKPRLGDTLPVYVTDDYEEFERAVPMIDLDDEDIEAYLSANVAVVERVVGSAGITAMHANHAVLMSVVASRVARKTGVPFAVMPHGSAIEYAVKKDDRFLKHATEALDDAARVFVIGREMRSRVLDTFAGVPGISEKLRDVVLGVDTGDFAPSPRKAREANIARLRSALAPLERGRGPDAAMRLRSAMRADMSRADLLAAFAAPRTDPGKRPDADLESNLGEIDWQRDDVLLYVGRLIAGKGVHSLIGALPAIFEACPKARLLIVGHGPQREVIEAIAWALEHGAIDLLRNIAAWGATLEDGPAAPYETLARYLEAHDRDRTLERYVEAGRRFVRADRVAFTGYLTHTELRHLLPCADAVVFPSVVKEAGPLVFLEALASGCFPLGTYVAGMAASIDAVADRLPPDHADLMKISADPALTIADIAAKTPPALALGGRYRDTLRDAVVERNDWMRIAAGLADELTGMNEDKDQVRGTKRGVNERVPG